ncbi:unnamed protein product [Symbiodinium sp. KB8]|nr:unnamed protein product [Symbiodinium sp. KB8]
MVPAVVAADGDHNPGHVLPLLLAVTFLVLLTVTWLRCTRRKRNATFEEMRAARANFKEDGGNLLAPLSMELTGSIAAAEDANGSVEALPSLGPCRFMLKVDANGFISGHGRRPHRHGHGFAEVQVSGKLRMETPQQGGMRWSERSEGSELAVSEVHGLIFIQGFLVQVAATFCTCDGETGMFQLRGSMEHLSTDADCHDGIGLALSETLGTQSLTTAGTTADLEQDVEAAITDPSTSTGHAAKL